MSILEADPDPAETGDDRHPLASATLPDFAREFRMWLDSHRGELLPLMEPQPDYEQRVSTARAIQRLLYDAGWVRFGWPRWAGGLGGNVLHRGVVYEELSRVGWHGPALFEHLEIIAPTLLKYGSPSFVSDVLPTFLDGSRAWAQGFSEPEAGSDLASLRTRATVDGDSLLLSGQKIWTSWAKWSDMCLALVRTGTAAERHRGLTMVALDLNSPGVEVRPIRQANGTDELAEVFLDEVRVDSNNVIGEIGGGWTVAMYLLAHERGTLSWFRNCHFQKRLEQAAAVSTEQDVDAIGAAAVRLSALRAAAGNMLEHEADDADLGPAAAFNKLMMTRTEQQLYDVLRAIHGPRLTIGAGDDDSALLHQEYLFSRIVTIYGGSQQMQLTTVAGRTLGLRR